MRIQHNIAALNSYRNLTGNNNSVSKNLEKLSSGYRINRAGDDAAGLAISEKMRAQITGLETAQKNANDGISLVQTAEGALTEVHSMLNRMVELADQSANGTYDNETDRANLQKEVQSLKEEIDRISEGTNFNGINLLDGSLGGSGGTSVKSVVIDNATTTASAIAKGKYTGEAITNPTLANNGDSFTYSVTYKDSLNGTNHTVDVSLSVSTNTKGEKVLMGTSGREYSLETAGTVGLSDIENALAKELNKTSLADKFDMTLTAGAGYVFESKEQGSSGAVITSITETALKGGTLTHNGQDVALTTAPQDAYKELQASGVTAYDGTNADDAIFSVNGQKFVLAGTGTDVTGLDSSVTVLTGTAFSADHAKVIAQKTGLSVSENGGKLTFKPGTKAGSGGLQLQIGDTSDSFNQLNVVVGDMSSKALGISGIDISSQGGAKSAVDQIKAAINKVSSTRGDLGAIQNRLEHTINNLSVTTENMTAAESRIRDVDMASEMMSYTKNNILVQASQAMLAQANQIPQGVLQLLQ